MKATIEKTHCPRLRCKTLFHVLLGTRMAISSHESPVAATMTWLTPPAIIQALGPFDLDPCTPPEMPWETAAKRYTEEDNGLIQPWEGRVWLNPPYGREIDAWMEKMALHGNGIALTFARTETAMWHQYVWPVADAILFVRGRLHFHKPDGARAKANAGAPSALIAYGRENARRLKAAGIEGRLVTGFAI